MNPGSPANRKEAKVSATIPYSLPGIICYLQHEWTKMEAERQSWNLQKAEYEAKISLLDGEIVGLRNLKIALTRRIKMLEHALVQERTQQANTSNCKEVSEINTENAQMPQEMLATIQPTSYTIRRGKQLIKKFLEEMGNVDDMIDLRCDRLKFSLQQRCKDKLLQANQQFNIPVNKESKIEVELKPLPSSEASDGSVTRDERHSKKDDDSYGGVIKEFNFLEESELSDEECNNWNMNAFDATKESTSWPSHSTNEHTNDQEKYDNYEVIDGIEYVPNGDIEEARFFDEQIAILASSNPDKTNVITVENSSFNELATLYGHLDVVRCVAFHPIASLLLTGSDDHTAKLWDISNILNQRSLCTEPASCLNTIRKHTSAVKSVTFGPKQNWFFTADVNGKIFMWSLVSLNCDDWSFQDQLIELIAELSIPNVSVVCIESITTMDVLIASCTDQTLQSWFVDKCDCGNIARSKHICTSDVGTAIRLLLVPTDVNIVVTAFDSATLAKWNVIDGSIDYMKTAYFKNETHKMIDAAYICHDETDAEFIIGAFDDGHLVWFDLSTGSILRTMRTHDNFITSVLSLPLTVLTAAHDGYIRLWSERIDQQFICRKERLVHRYKADEAISTVSCRIPYFSTAGADGLCRIFILNFLDNDFYKGYNRKSP